LIRGCSLSNPVFFEIASLAFAVTLPLQAWGADQPPKVDGEVRFNSGLTNLREGRLDLALDEFKAAVKEDPKNPYFYKGLGVAYAAIADRCKDDACRQVPLREAVAAARKALELNPYYVDARNDLGAALIRSGQRDEGKKELVAAFNDPTNPSPEITARNLGQAFFEDKNLTESLTWFQTSLGRNRSYPDAWLGIGDVLVAQGRLDEAVSQLEAATKELPQDWSVALALGEAYYRAGRFAEARKPLELVAGKDPAGPLGRRAVQLLQKFPNP
jgi:Flp pilus assembly protein TadD